MKLLHRAALTVALALVSACSANASTIYNALGGAENGGDPISAAGAGPVLADRFISPVTGTLGAVTLNLSLAAGAFAGQGFTVNLFSDNGASGPGASLFQIASVSDSLLSSAFSELTFTPASAYQLTSGQSYYIGVTDNGSNGVLGNTLDPAVLGRPGVAAGASYYNNGGVQANAGGPYEIGVDTAVTPEPASLTLLLTGVGALAVIRRKFFASQAV